VVLLQRRAPDPMVAGPGEQVVGGRELVERHRHGGPDGMRGGGQDDGRVGRLEQLRRLEEGRQRLSAVGTGRCGQRVAGEPQRLDLEARHRTGPDDVPVGCRPRRRVVGQRLACRQLADGGEKGPRGGVAAAGGVAGLCPGPGEVGDLSVGARRPAPEPAAGQQCCRHRQGALALEAGRLGDHGVGQVQGVDGVAAERCGFRPAGGDVGGGRAGGDGPVVPAARQLGGLGERGVAGCDIRGGDLDPLGARRSEVLAGAGGRSAALGQSGGEARVEAPPVGDRRHLVGGRGHERHDVARPRNQQAGGVQVVDGVAQPVRRDVRRRAEQLVVEVGARAERLEHRAGGRLELVDPGAQSGDQRWSRWRRRTGELAPADGARVDPSRQQQLHQAGHAPGLIVDGVDQPVADRGVEHDRGELTDLGLVEGTQGGQHLVAGEDGVERGQQRVAGDGAVGDHDGEAPLRRPLGDTDDDT
jgi:hypothetical protein